MPNAPSSAPPNRTAPLALWRVAEAFLHILYNLFGAPEDVAFQHTLTREPHARIASWLRVGEAMLRRLLVIEASAYPKPNTPPILWPKRARTRKQMGFDSDAPEKWRVSFRCFMDPALRQAQGDAKSDAAVCVCVGRSLSKAKRARISREDRWCFENFKPVSFRSAWPLAERYEAMIRVFNNPEPYARRLARRLYAEPHRLCEALRAPEEAPHRVERFEEMGATAAARWKPPNTS
jgi:hypothetical protein